MSSTDNCPSATSQERGDMRLGGAASACRLRVLTSSFLAAIDSAAVATNCSMPGVTSCAGMTAHVLLVAGCSHACSMQKSCWAHGMGVPAPHVPRGWPSTIVIELQRLPVRH